ncbi:hypothetical protein [Parvularcula sp. IMCC14364]|uniref:hypothetical protein n=1 Tax=Parvularcula sp. IMCC14364 TaxID=3067902 RepID=UPI0027405E75|nr:hypothetical protein [Parvularcula sp. IMCC14364]
MSGDYDFQFKHKDRKRLNAVSQRIFDRLVSIDDNFVNLINSAENAVTGFVMITGLVSLFGGIWYGIGQILGMPFMSGVPERFTTESAHLMISGVVTLPVFFFIIWRPLQAMSDNILEWVGRWIITTRKFGQNRQKKTAVLDAVSNWMRTRPEQATRIYEQLYKQNPKDLFPPELREKLETLTAANDKPYLLIERFTEIKPWTEYAKYWFFSPRNEERKIYFLRSRALRNAIKIALAYHIMNTELRDEVPAGDRWVREYKTERNRQITALFDEIDLHNRFRTSAPHYRWPDNGRKKSVGETATLRAISCIENPSGLPLFVLPVKDVMNEFQGVIRDFYEDAQGEDEASLEIRQDRYEAIISKLADINVKMFGKYSRKTLLTTSETGIEPQPILRDLALSRASNADIEDVLHDEEHVHDWALRWDPNFIAWPEIQDDAESDTSQSFAVLYEAIERAGRKATPIVLERGDTLFIDNLRCLITRPLDRKQAITGYPQDWWLRGYYGFRMSEQTSFDLSSTNGSYSSFDDDVYRDEFGITWPFDPKEHDARHDSEKGVSLKRPTKDRAVSFTSSDKAPYCRIEPSQEKVFSETHDAPENSGRFLRRGSRPAKRQPGSIAQYLKDWF